MKTLHNSEKDINFVRRRDSGLITSYSTTSGSTNKIPPKYFFVQMIDKRHLLVSFLMKSMRYVKHNYV